MHELALCESIRSIIEDQARAQGFAKVERVALEVGAFSGVEIEALRFGFDVAMNGSVAQGATLEIVELPGEGWCMPCGRAVRLARRYDECPHCGGVQIQVTGGEDLKIRELEVC